MTNSAAPKRYKRSLRSLGRLTCVLALLGAATTSIVTGASLLQAQPAGATTRVVSVASSGEESSCAVLSNGTVNCWGLNLYGELGNGTETPSDLPVVARGVTDAVSVTSDYAEYGQSAFCALLSTGGVDCWGYGEYGELGNGGFGSEVPVAVTGLTDAVSVTSGGTYSFCALLSTGGVDCWGYGQDGELGNGTTGGDSAVPVAVSGITNAASLIGGDSNIAGPSVYCAVLTTGSVDCWGENGSGELGDGNTTSSDVPVAVTGLTDAISVSDDGYQALCALLTTGSVECWGDNQNGESGNGTIGFTIPYTDVPVTVSSIDNAVSLSNDGTGAFCAVLASGGVDCWGSNNLGQLGDGTTGRTNSMCGDYRSRIPSPSAGSPMR